MNARVAALHPLFRGILAPVAPPMSDAEKVKRLRSALHRLLDLMASFEDVTLTRDLPAHEAESVYISEKENAYQVLRETA